MKAYFQSVDDVRIGEDSNARYGVANRRAQPQVVIESANLFQLFRRIATERPRGQGPNLGFAGLQTSNTKRVGAPVLDCPLDVPGLGKVAGSRSAQQLLQLIVGGEAKCHYLSVAQRCDLLPDGRGENLLITNCFFQPGDITNRTMDQTKLINITGKTKR